MISREKLEALTIRISHLEEQVKNMKIRVYPERYSDWERTWMDRDGPIVLDLLKRGRLLWLIEQLCEWNEFGSYRDQLAEKYKRLVTSFIDQEESRITFNELQVILEFLFYDVPDTAESIRAFCLKYGFDLNEVSEEKSFHQVITIKWEVSALERAQIDELLGKGNSVSFIP